MKRRAFLGVLGAAPWFASVPYSAPQDTVPKIGYLTPNVQGVTLEQGFHQGCASWATPKAAASSSNGDGRKIAKTLPLLWRLSWCKGRWI